MYLRTSSYTVELIQGLTTLSGYEPFDTSVKNTHFLQLTYPFFLTSASISTTRRTHTKKKKKKKPTLPSNQRNIITMDASTTTSFVSNAINGALSRIPALDSTNYRQWSFVMQYLLDGEDLWEIVKPATTTTTTANAEPQGSQTHNRTRT